MDHIIYKNLTIESCARIREIDASQFIGRAWREVDGVRQLVTINYQDPDWPNGFEAHLDGLKETIKKGGCAIGAFSSEDNLLGFVTVNPESFGEKFRHVLMDQLFVTLPYRGKGLGRGLFEKSIEVVRRWPVDKLYICAGSAEETVAFYFAMGCVEAEEVNLELYEEDPRDFQLEYLV